MAINKKLCTSLIIALCAAVGVVAMTIVTPDLYQGFESKALDLRFKLRSPLSSPRNIVFLEIDTPSLQALGRWPWPRDVFAKIIDTLHALKAKAVLFDVIFSEPSTKESDLLFAESVKRAGNVYLGSHFDIKYSPEDIARDRHHAGLEKTLSRWFSSNPSAGFSSAPASITGLPGFTAAERRAIFTKLKLEYLFGRNAEMTFDDAAQFFEGEDPAILRPLYYESKTALMRTKIESVFATRGVGTSESLAGRLGIFNPDDRALMEDISQDVVAQRAFAEKAGIRLQGADGFFDAAGISYPILPLTEAMAGCGHLNAVFDKDGTLRKVPLFVRYKEMVYPHLALRYYADMAGVNFPKGVHYSSKALMIGKVRIPVDEKGQMLLNWRGKWQESFLHLSIARVYQLWDLEQEAAMARPHSSQERDELRGTLGPQVKDAVCIVGLTAPGTQDFLPMPLEPNYPAVGTYATILSSLFEGRFLSAVPSGVNYAMIFLLALLVAVCAGMFSAGMSLLCVGLIVALYCAVAATIFMYGGVCIDIVGPCASAALSYVGVTGFFFSSEEREKRWIRKAFGKFISKNVMEEILKDPAKLKLGGEKRELTLLFADVRGFTPYSEKHTPEEVVAILNEYLQEMSRIVLKHDGTLDKYVGDEIVVIFGAPYPQSDHANRAVTAALEMVERVRQLQQKWRGEGKDPLDIGIGINSGLVIVGNMGSSERMNYTAIGDAVNLAARIQTLTRDFNNHIMISEYTYALVKGGFEVKPLEPMKVKGKDDPVMMYEVIGLGLLPQGPGGSEG